MSCGKNLYNTDTYNPPRKTEEDRSDKNETNNDNNKRSSTVGDRFHGSCGGSETQVAAQTDNDFPRAAPR